MARVVVDELVVALRLDDSQFDRAVAEAIAARQKIGDEAEKQEKREGDSVGRSIGRYLKWAAILAAVGKTYAAVLDISDNLMDLENSSRRLGQSAHGLRTWQNAMEMLGGKASDATGEVEKFQESLNALIFKGDVGENLQWLNRLGVTPQRGMSYDDTSRRVFSGIQQGLASGTIKDRQEAGFIARQAGFAGVGAYITQNPNAGIDQFNAFLASAAARATPNGTAATGAGIGRFVTSKGQEVQLNKEVETAKNAELIKQTVAAVASGKQIMTDFMSITAQSVSLIGDVFTGEFNDEIQKNRPEGGWRGSPEMRRRNPVPTPSAVPTPNVMGGSSSSKSVTINQTNNIRSTDPTAAGNAVAEKTRKAINAQSDGASR